MPERAALSTSTEWLGGTQTRTRVATTSGREFTIDADYPDALLGSGLAPSPPEVLMAALGASFVTSFVLAAAAADVRIEFMRVVVARPASDGAGEFELHGAVEANTSSENLERLVDVARERSLADAVGGLRLQVRLDHVDEGRAR